MKAPKEIVLKQISKFLKGVVSTMIKDVPPEIEGDYAFPCFAHAKQMGKKPQELAEELAGKLQGSTYIARVEADKGFVNITLNTGKLADELIGEIETLKGKFGAGSNTGTLIVEHTSANPNAPLHVGHLRNSVIGDSMIRILKFTGYKVESQFLVNDMGGQLAILASFLEGVDYVSELKKSGQKSDAWLGDMYVQANRDVDPEVGKALQKTYEKGSKKTRKTFDFMVATALQGFKETLANYNISLDNYVRESDFLFGGKVETVLKKLEKTPYWFEKEGVFALDLEKYGIDKEIVLLRSDGTTLYTTRDLAYHMWKLKSGDCINVIANEQTLQQRQLRAGLDILGVDNVEKRVRHLSYELVTVPGMRMSSRTGEFISADELLEHGVKNARREIEERKLEIPEAEKEKIAKAVAVGAVRFNMVKITPLKPIEFKWEDALNFEGESAPYLQYSHARACRILEKVKSRQRVEFPKIDFTKEESKLLLALAKFPEKVQAAAEDLKPNLLANYLVALAEAFNRFYFKCPVLDSEEPLRSARISMVKSFKQVMGIGLGLLGIEALERM